MSRSNLFILIAIFIFASTQQVQSQNYTYMGSYNLSGLPNYLITPRDNVSSNFRNSIATTLPEYRPVPVYNPLLISKNHVKTIGTNCPSDIWISFIDEGASYLNTLGYYTYPKGNPPTVAPNNKDITIIFPNASKSGFGGSMVAGDKVFLGRFPANVEIGFVLISDGWDGSKVTNGNWKVYSNSEFNPESNDSLKQHTVIVRDTLTNRLVIGFEDILRDRNDCDQDFNDLLFYATIDPILCTEKLDSIPIFSEDGGVSFSGNTGGLESQGLGNKIAKRTMAKIKQGTNGPVNYSTMQKLDLSYAQIINMSTNRPLTLSDIMPDRIPEGAYTAYISTPTDIPAITNAIEVRAVDFTENDTCKAVAFATKTLGKVYDHTKPICDRLKGAVLLKMDQFTLRNLIFTRYELKQENGNTEYSMSFSIGKKAGRNSFSFQSNWLNADFIGEDTMYNYQIWGVAPYLCIDLALNVLDKLEAIMPVQTIAAAKPLPTTYIRYGNRDGLNVNLLVENETNFNSGYIELVEKYNELSPLNVKRTIPFTLNTKGKTMISFPMNDTHESLISMFINGKLQDVVYMSDGSWDLDYDSTKTVIESYTVTNDSVRNFADTYPVFRDVNVKAKTDGYLSAYKLLRGAAAEQDLTAYRTMSFKAKGEGTTLRITLIKNSIKDFTKQPHYNLPLTKSLTDYTINLEDFVGEDALVAMSAGLPIVAVPNTAGLPKVYVTEGTRLDENVVLTFKNNTNATSGYLEITDRANEQATSKVKRTIPFTAIANGTTSVSIPTGDLFESNINLFLNGKLEDQVFMADGAWGVDYNTNTSSLKKFVVTNDNTTKSKDEFNLFRNAEIAGITPDYLTVYKLLRAGGVSEDLSEFKSIKFKALGNAPLKITLVKESIKQWNDQYSLTMPISGDSKEYMIGLDDFKSIASNAKIDLKDITTIVFTIVPPSVGKSTDIQLGLSNISFSKEDINYINSLKVKSIDVFPNPVTGNQFNVRFKSDAAKTLQLKISDAVTGRVVFTKQVNAIRGENIVPVVMDNNGSQKVMIINLDGTGADSSKYKASKIIAGKY